MFLWANKGLEKTPGLPGELPQKDALIGGNPCFAVTEWQTDPPGYYGGGKPKA
jgi:hypothetical protein